MFKDGGYESHVQYGYMLSILHIVNVFFALNEYNYSVLVYFSHFTMEDYFLLVLQFFVHKYLSWSLFLSFRACLTPLLAVKTG